MKCRRALVLEDCNFRIDYIQELRFFDTIVHHETVKGFSEAWENRDSAFDLLILDHDLGGDLMNSRDAEGKTGQHAVTFLCRQETKLPPILVWSCNPTGGDLMAKRLAEKGHRAYWIPYFRFVDDAKVYLSEAVKL